MIRRTASIVLVVFAAEAAIALLGAAVVLWTGAFNVAATARHTEPTRWLLHAAMRYSVAARAGGIAAPPFDDPMALRGASHYAGGCMPCHGAPGERPSAVERNAEPAPPPYAAFAGWSPSELFWIVKHGIKLTAMPPWAEPARDDEIWDVVSFLVLLPQLTPERFKSMAGRTPSRAASTQPPLQTLAQAPPDGVRVCAACHGEDGTGRGGAFPRLSGLPLRYIERTLRDFRSGDRASGVMERVTAELSDSDIGALARYYAAKRPPEASTAHGEAKASATGERIARYGMTSGRIPPCQSCHGVDQSTSAGVPSLAQQPVWYIERQLALFRAGARGSSPAVRAMASIANALSDSDSAAVAAYYADQPATAAR